MAKEIAIGKRGKITKAQQNMLLAVLGASIFLGVAVSLVIHFIKQISFNAEVIVAKDQAIIAYSDVIESTGVCKKPRGAVYSNDELKSCNPNGIELSEIPDTLRSNILEKLAANEALNSVPKESTSGCINPLTNKGFTYEELNKAYDESEGADQLAAASQLIKKCSALRIIPDALPAFRNEEALLASLNKIFLISGSEPESLSPSGSDSVIETGEGLNGIVVNLSLDKTSVGPLTALLNNIERSIREFNLNNLTLEWDGSGTVKFGAQATVYYMDESQITEVTKTITAEEQ